MVKRAFGKVPIVAWVAIYVVAMLGLYQSGALHRLTSLSSSLAAAPDHARQFQARNITAAELMARPLSADLTTIPRLLHQSWKTDVLPAKFEQWSKGCRTQHPDWEWVLWTNEDNLALVQKYYPWLEDSYRNLRSEIFRADLVRALYMYTFGGVYMDLDTDCLQPSEVVFENYVPKRQKPLQTALVGRMGNDPGFEHSIPNAWMASPPGHPLWLLLPEKVDERVKDKSVGDVLPESLTGPVALRDAIIEYETRKVKNGNGLGESVVKMRKGVPLPGALDDGVRDHEVVLLPSEIIYPYSWGGDGEKYRDFCWVLKDGYSADRCKSELNVKGKGSVCITYWSHTHSPDGEDAGNIAHITS